MGQAIACGRLDQLQLEGLAAERLTVFPSGLAILIAIFETLDIEHDPGGWCPAEGLIYGLLGNNHDCDARDRTADSLISRYQLDKEHAERVRDTAIEAFTQLQPAWRLSKRYGRPILRYAALLHEIGLCIEYKKAPQHAAIIDNIDMPGFTPRRRSCCRPCCSTSGMNSSWSRWRNRAPSPVARRSGWPASCASPSSSACAGPRALCPGSCCKPMKMP
jgi:exopolyphosphatase/guanosine-5'-triphosphate,3'-diphosphate pyrophosphatase